MLLQALVPDYDVYATILGNSSVTTVALGDDGRWVIVAANDVSHLEGLTSRTFAELEEQR
jgi:hypothetical protein